MRCDPETGSCEPFVEWAEGPDTDFLGNFTFGPGGHLFVAVASRVEEYRADGSFLRNAIGTGGGGLNEARDLQFGSDGSLYVASRNSNEVIRYSIAGLAVVIGRLAAPELTNPYGIDLLPDGSVLVTGSETLLRFNPDDTLDRVLVPDSSGELGGARDVATDGKTIYVIDFPGNEVLQYSVEGSPLGRLVTVGRPSYLDLSPELSSGPGVLLLLGSESLSISGGDLLEVSARFVNGPVEQTTRLFAWLQFPDGRIRSILPTALGGDFVFEPNRDTTTTRILGNAGAPPIQAEGRYLIGIRVVDAASGGLLSQAIREFEVTP